MIYSDDLTTVEIISKGFDNEAIRAKWNEEGFSICPIVIKMLGSVAKR